MFFLQVIQNKSLLISSPLNKYSYFCPNYFFFPIFEKCGKWFHFICLWHAVEFEDYIKFLCSLPNTTSRDIYLATGVACETPTDTPSDLNLPSITISSLRGCQLIRRYVKNVAGKAETYLAAVHAPDGVSVHVNPSWFEIGLDGIQHLEITFNVTEASESFSFGELVFIGSLDHIVRLPLVVRPML